MCQWKFSSFKHCVHLEQQNKLLLNDTDALVIGVHLNCVFWSFDYVFKQLLKVHEFLLV